MSLYLSSHGLEQRVPHVWNEEKLHQSHVLQEHVFEKFAQLMISLVRTRIEKITVNHQLVTNADLRVRLA